VRAKSLETCRQMHSKKTLVDKCVSTNGTINLANICRKH
jgi:hypothetical protein